MNDLRTVVAAALVALAPLPAVAQDMEGFQSPTSNIMCMFYGDGIRCDVMQISNRPPPRPADCDLEWGQAFDLGVSARRGVRMCYGDTVAGNYRALAYGRTFSRAGITCLSDQSGITCTNRRGAGFFVSRGSQRVF